MSENHEITIAMPNELLFHLPEWLSNKELKSNQHQEFIYSYLWLISYYWRYARYAEEKITQQTIKSVLGYNPDEKRLNYIVKKNGLLDAKGYTSTTKNYPVSWSFENSKEGVSFTMLKSLDLEFQALVSKFKSENYQVKCPLVSVGTDVSEGIYWNTDNTHFMSQELFDLCMKHPKLQCAGFYLCGVLKYIGDKNYHFSSSLEFECSNDALKDFTNWSIRRIAETTNTLMSIGLIHKEQKVKSRGQRNSYKLFF
ncbi:hypothetical protein ABE073_04065 [Lederbergia citrisecunda]|uniref:hypothetical protein n=1 Tax=Lederbergia citrisecunda TaxID=2833583 RepID=UPI003D2D17CA